MQPPVMDPQMSPKAARRATPWASLQRSLQGRISSGNADKSCSPFGRRLLRRLLDYRSCRRRGLMPIMGQGQLVPGYSARHERQKMHRTSY